MSMTGGVFYRSEGSDLQKGFCKNVIRFGCPLETYKIRHGG